jgi:hypothetical protein
MYKTELKTKQLGQTGLAITLKSSDASSPRAQPPLRKESP